MDDTAPNSNEKYNYAITQASTEDFCNHLKQDDVQDRLLKVLKKNNGFDDLVLDVLRKHTSFFDIVWNSLFWHLKFWMWIAITAASISFLVFSIPEIRGKISSWFSSTT